MLKVHEALSVLHHEVTYAGRKLGRCEESRMLAILATDLEKCQVWAESKLPGAETHLVNPNEHKAS